MLRITPRCFLKSLNRISLVGVAREVQAGFIGDEACLQFMLVVHNLQDSPPQQTTPSSKPIVGVAAPFHSIASKQQFVVRCLTNSSGDATDWKSVVQDGCVVRVTGQFKHNYQTDQGRRHAFPFVLITSASGSIVPLLLHNKPVKRSNVSAKS